MILPSNTSRRRCIGLLEMVANVVFDVRIFSVPRGTIFLVSALFSQYVFQSGLESLRFLGIHAPRDTCGDSLALCLRLDGLFPVIIFSLEKVQIIKNAIT
jgi:hypothetical protein